MDTVVTDLLHLTPNFVGFLIALFYMYKTTENLIAMNTRLQEAIIKRENCEDDEAK
jgi:hypothetical protein